MSKLAIVQKLGRPSIDALLEERKRLEDQLLEIQKKLRSLQNQIDLHTRPKWEEVRLSAREREVLHLLEYEVSNKEIAARLLISERGVKFHVSKLLCKLQKHTRGELIAMKKLMPIILGLVAVLLLGMAAPVHAQQGPPQATLNWTNPTVPTPAALSILVERATAATGPWNTVTTVNAPTATYVDTAVVRGSTYWWRVTSSCPATGNGCGTQQAPMNGSSAPSASVTGTVPNSSVTPPAPSSLTLTIP